MPHLEETLRTPSPHDAGAGAGSSARSRSGRAFVLAALLALAARALVIERSPLQDDLSLDLKIYREAGGMQSAGLNPYAFSQLPECRAALRLDPWNYDPWLCRSQEVWDYYVSGNLPASTILYAAIDRAAPSGRAYRMTFAILDSIAAGLVAVVVLRSWSGQGPRCRELLAIALGPLNPILLVWGAYYPEDKGAQIGIMIGAYLAARSRAPAARWASALLLGTSIAFKLFGVFLVPLCVALAVGHGALGVPSAVRRGLGYLTLVILTVLAWFIPYHPYALGPLLARFLSQGGLQFEPIHAAPWGAVSAVLGAHIAAGLRLAATAALVVAAAQAARVGRAGLPTACADLLMAYGGAWLVTGGLDRYDMAFLPALCLVGTQDGRAGVQLAAGYLSYALFLALGWLVPAASGLIDGWFTLGFLCWYGVVRASMAGTRRAPVERSEGAPGG